MSDYGKKVSQNITKANHNVQRLPQMECYQYEQETKGRAAISKNIATDFFPDISKISFLLFLLVFSKTNQL